MDYLDCRLINAWHLRNHFRWYVTPVLLAICLSVSPVLSDETLGSINATTNEMLIDLTTEVSMTKSTNHVSSTSTPKPTPLSTATTSSSASTALPKSSPTFYTETKNASTVLTTRSFSTNSTKQLTTTLSSTLKTSEVATSMKSTPKTQRTSWKPSLSSSTSPFVSTSTVPSTTSNSSEYSSTRMQPSSTRAVNLTTEHHPPSTSMPTTPSTRISSVPASSTPNTTPTTSTTPTPLPTSTEPTTVSSPLTTPYDRTRFCHENKTYEYSTRCKPCANTTYVCRMPLINGIITYNAEEPRQENCKMASILSFFQSKDGCQFSCRVYYLKHKCCDGYWGDKCQECPGGSQSPCNNNGFCSPYNGRCQCNFDFKGTTCDMCEDITKYGPNCENDCQCVHGRCENTINSNGTCHCETGYLGTYCDQTTAGCEKLACDEDGHWICEEGAGVASCVCDNGFRLEPSNNTCIAIDACARPEDNTCGNNTNCTSDLPGTFQCHCKEGYEPIQSYAAFDKTHCTPIDACKTNNGGCEANSMCKSTGPNQRICECKPGFQSYEAGSGCSLIDICKPTSCDPDANCTTVDPGTTVCTCKDGFVGDGSWCHGNLLQTLKKLNKMGRTRGNLNFAIDVITRFYEEPMSNHGPFTLFIPNDRAFKNERRSNRRFGALLQDRDKMLQILRQHILIGRFKLEDLQVFDKFYTLQGNAAVLQIRVARGVFKYKLQGSRRKSKVVNRNLFAYNGVIHVVNNLMTLQPEISGDTRKSALQLIQKEPQYNQFELMIKSANLSHLYDDSNITVFAPRNTAWTSLPEGTLEYLTTHPEGRQKLTKILRHHVYPGTFGVTHLVNTQLLKSRLNTALNVTVTKLGQVRLGGRANIIQANIPCASGYYHHVDNILIPDYIKELLKKRCDQEYVQDVVGQCSLCSIVKCPRPTDTFTRNTRQCTGTRFWHEKKYPLFCEALCTRNSTKRQCCDGFYGSNCSPCPGGFQSPCNGKGKCNDGIGGSGSCDCEQAFSGTACQKCSQANVFGPNCDQNCTCLYGRCANGPRGSGTCKPNSCRSGYVGQNCNKKLVKCGGDTILCHAHATCLVGQDNVQRCFCDMGYEEDGEDCVEINPCLKDRNGGCDPQATCTKLGPGIRRCTCNTGWMGDGFACLPHIKCNDHNDCSQNATCENPMPGVYSCACKAGFTGDGRKCTLIDKCQHNNGGCHMNATCQMLVTGNVNCTCPDNMGGDGVTCVATIAEQIRTHPNLTRLARLLEELSPRENILDEKDEDWTFFAPSDDAMDTYMVEAQFSGRNITFPDNSYKVIEFIKFHTLYEAFDREELLQVAKVYKKFQTMSDGTFLHILNVNQSLQIFVNHTSFASIVQPNLLAMNGYLHVVDKILEPFMVQDDPPFVNDVMKNDTKTQIFYKAFTDTNMWDVLKEKDEYTIFIPPDDAFETDHLNISQKFLQYYIVPRLLFTPSILHGDRADTLLGSKYKLAFTVSGETVQVNDVDITQPNILFEGGVAHKLAGLLHPVVNHCDDIMDRYLSSECGYCPKGPSDYPCPEGSVPADPPAVIRRPCQVTPKGRAGYILYNGCRQMCTQEVRKPQCCAGYFGTTCKACPGGAETPCNNNGACFSGRLGSGTCVCQPDFEGTACEMCKNRDMVPPRCDVKYESCGYLHGNCSENAACSEVGDTVTCRCKPGYVGDGYNCTHVCHLADRGGCHDHADCSFNAATHLAECTCTTGYHGNGTSCEENVDLCIIHNGGCDPDRATCRSPVPRVTDLVQEKAWCECLQDYVGNGTLCVTDTLDALSRIPMLGYFSEFFHEAVMVNLSKTSTMLQNDHPMFTLFAPVSQDWQQLNIDQLVVPDIVVHLSPIFHMMVDYNGSGISHLRTFVSLSGEVINVTVTDGDKYDINGVEVVAANIETLDGMLHLTAQPIVQYRHVDVGHSRESSTAASSTALIAGVVAAVVVLVVIAAVVAVVVYRKKKNQVGLFQVFKSSQYDSDSNLSFARLNAQDDDSSDSFKGSDSARYENPVFNDPEFL